MDVYHRLANHFDKNGDQRQRDIFLTLAADSALSSGDPSQAELHFRRLLSKSPHHFLGGYGSFAEARGIMDVQMYLDDLRHRYPPNQAEKMLDTQRRENVPNRPPSDSQQDLYQNWMQSGAKPPPNPAPQPDSIPQAIIDLPDDIPLDRTVAFVQRGQHAPTPPPPKPKKPAPQQNRSTPETGRPKRAPIPKPKPPNQHVPSPTPPGLQQPIYQPISERPCHEESQSSADVRDDEELEPRKGEWVSATLFFLMIIAAVALAVHTLVYPLF